MPLPLCPGSIYGDTRKENIAMEQTEKKLEKYYTAFVMLMRDSVARHNKLFHCKHKYLGEQPLSHMREVQKICEEYFTVSASHPAPIFPLCVFNKEDLFGPDKNIRVLRSFIDPIRFFPGLREQLQYFREDDFDEYRPHITCDLPYKEINGSFHCYAIMSGQDKIYSYWPNLKSPHVKTS
jgi:hypothetical protein